jgi:predicted amino acid dehydrogenase
MREVINISLSSPSGNFDEILELDNKKVRVKRLGTNYNYELTKQLISHYRDNCDVMALTGFPNEIPVGRKIYTHPQLRELRSLAGSTPLVNGRHLRQLYVPWCLRGYAQENPAFFSRNSISFFAGSLQKNFLDEIKNLSEKLVFSDPYFFFGIPQALNSVESLDRFIQASLPILNQYRVTKFSSTDYTKNYLRAVPGFRHFFSSKILVANETQLSHIKIDRLKGKTLIIDYIPKRTEKELRDAGVENIVSCFPEVFSLPYAGFSVMEAVFQAMKDERTPLTLEEVFEWIEKLQLKPSRKRFQKDSSSDTAKFGFVVHPLSSSDILRHPYLRPFRFSKSIKNLSERTLATLPGFKYGKIEGIQSSYDGKKVEGDIYGIFETPKMMLKAEPETIYKKLVTLTEKAFEDENEIFGLGAFTKIVGDAGVTVANRSPLPVTTGNSLSSASTLWAASFAVDRMNMVSKNKENGVYQGTAMVVGATGSIGKVSAKLLAQSWEKIVLVAPRPYKLLELADEVRALNPECQVKYAVDANVHAHSCDLIITTTSAHGQRIIDIDKVKSGAVICDVSRPFDISEEDAVKRPDVLVIASGEVQLPGDPKLTCDIGLPGNTVYACLAETAILAMEGRFESFSLSRDLSYKKVKEIDRLARKHGVKLSAIMGHDTEITDEEIQLCREHAMRRIAQSKNEPFRVNTRAKNFRILRAGDLVD